MKKLLIFVVLLIGCSEEHEIDKKICSPFRMTISDAIPIQFWVNGVETYNQKEVCGITPVCYCQKFNASDEIKIQVLSDSDIILVVYDALGNELETLSVPKISDGVAQIEFIPENYGITNEQIRFSLFESGGSDVIQPLSTWVNTLSINPLAVSGNNFVANNITGGTNFGREQPFPLPTPIGDDVTFNVTIEITGVWTGLVRASFIITTTSGYESYSINFTSNQSPTIHNIVIPGLYPSSSPTPELLWVYVEDVTGLVGSANMQITMPVGDVIYFEEGERADSDCIDIRENHDCTELIRYRNSKDFAGISYTNASPTADFYKRIPAVFFHETNPTEEERFETSGQTIVRLRDEIKVKRNLQVGYMPDHEHRKLLLILAHDTVEIDGDTWVRNDPYEKVPPANKRYPLKMANVLLTLQGYIKRNIL